MTQDMHGFQVIRMDQPIKVQLAHHQWLTPCRSQHPPQIGVNVDDAPGNIHLPQTVATGFQGVEQASLTGLEFLLGLTQAPVHFLGGLVGIIQLDDTATPCGIHLRPHADTMQAIPELCQRHGQMATDVVGAPAHQQEETQIEEYQAAHQRHADQLKIAPDLGGTREDGRLLHHAQHDPVIAAQMLPGHLEGLAIHRDACRATTLPEDLLGQGGEDGMSGQLHLRRTQHVLLLENADVRLFDRCQRQQ